MLQETSLKSVDVSKKRNDNSQQKRKLRRSLKNSEFN